MARAFAVDLGHRQIRVNSIAPGYVRTRMTEAAYQDPIANQERMGRTILGRWGEPHDLVGAAIFLAADVSDYVTGQEIVVDGGWSAKGL
jgi:NAD(P)-dependent dehydrogenase (short-subunit alcohol dehydrogenase family)